MSASLWQAPLTDVQCEVAAAQPAPAGVAVACVTAALAVSLLVKVLRITGQRPDLLHPALDLIDELRAAADADVAAVQLYIETRNTRAMQDVPAHAAHSAARASALCAEAALSITGLIAADIAAARALLSGSIIAINGCITANQA